MNFDRLTLDNFLTIGHAEFDLANRGLLLIQGENADDSSAKSNGAGKSSGVDGLCWVIFGVTARGVTGDDVINATAKKDCQGSITLDDDGARYRIERNRKNGPKKNQLFIHRIDGPAEVDMSKGTDKETQEVINKVIGCSLDVFCASVYAGQEKMPDLPGMTDKQLKVLIEEAAGVEVLAATHALALKAHTTAKLNLDTAAARLELARTSKEDAANRLEGAKQAHKEHADGRLDRAKVKMAEAAPHLENVREWKAELAKIDETAVKAMQDEGQSELDAIQPMLKDQAAMDAEVSRLERDAAVIQNTIDSNKRTLKAKKAEIENMEALIGTPCKSCGKEYCEHDLATATAVKKDDLAKQVGETKAHIATWQAAVASAEKAKADADAHRAKIPSIKDAQDKVARARIVLTAVAGLNSKISGAETLVARIKSDAQAIVKDTTNPYDALVTKAQDEDAKFDALVSTREGEVVSEQEKLELAQDLVVIYGPKGVRAHILDTVTPFLNDRTREYLGALSDGNIHATWSTLTTNAKGELKEKFQIEVIHDKGAKKFDGLSGGEKRKVRLACALALQDMVASRATKPLNIFIGDEIDHALDEPGLERLMSVLDRKARERGTVLVISHNSLADWIDQVIVVKKEGGLSTVTGDNVK